MIRVYAGISLLFLFLLVRYLRSRPVKEVVFVSMEELCHIKEQEPVQILDVRDPVDYEQKHLKDAINIYIGRLPFVSLKELEEERKLFIVASSPYVIHRAARILKKAGYSQLYGLVWRQEQMEEGLGDPGQECCAC